MVASSSRGSGLGSVMYAAVTVPARNGTVARRQRPSISCVSELRGLLVDYGGVLTTPLEATLAHWAQVDGIDQSEYLALMRRWHDTATSGSPVHELETGRLSVEDFEIAMAAELVRADGARVPAKGLLQRMLGGFRPEPSMVNVVAAARAGGIRTALLSNSWGLNYPREGWDRLFDAVVISGEVGMRKPDPEIFLHTTEVLGLAPTQCVFVDDLAPNVRAAAEVGMVGVHHTDVDSTLAELEILFERSFS